MGSNRDRRDRKQRKTNLHHVGAEKSKNLPRIYADARGSEFFTSTLATLVIPF
jgi:hypothetical protein